MSKDQSIIRMANDIANNAAVFGGDDPVQMVSEHINKFWAPVMRQRLIELIGEDPSVFNEYVISGRTLVRCEIHNPIKVEFKDKSGTGG